MNLSELFGHSRLLDMVLAFFEDFCALVGVLGGVLRGWRVK
jgi:hypothetical protein